MDVGGDIITEQPMRGLSPRGSAGMQMHRSNPNFSMCPPGMEHLASTSMIFVQQIVEMLEAFTGFDTNNRYEVLGMGGQRLFFAAEQSACCTRWCMGSRRPFTILILNSHGGISLKAQRVCSCCYCFCYGNCCNELRITTGTDVYIGKVTQNLCDCLCPRFTVWDAQDKEQLHINGPCNCCLCCSVHFAVKDNEGNEIGEIHKKWGGILKELYTTADTFGVSFPIDLDVRLKTLLLGAVFLIDFMYFEHKGHDHHQQHQQHHGGFHHEGLHHEGFH